MLEELGVPPPFRHVVTVPSGSGVDLTDLSVTGMGGASARRTTCAITVDGQTVARSSADGAYGLVTCVVPSSRGSGPVDYADNVHYDIPLKGAECPAGACLGLP